MAGSIRQNATFVLGAGGGVFGIFHQMALALDTLPGSTLVIWGGCSASQGFAPQAAQNSGNGSPAVTGDATNGIYTQADNVVDATGSSIVATFVKQNAAAVTAGTLFTLNYSGSCDYNSMYVMEITGVDTASLLGHNGLVTSVGGAGTDTVSSGTAALGTGNVFMVAGCYGSNAGTLADVGSASTSYDVTWNFSAVGHPLFRIETQRISNPGTLASFFSPTATEIHIALMLGFAEAGITLNIDYGATEGRDILVANIPDQTAPQLGMAVLDFGDAPGGNQSSVTVTGIASVLSTSKAEAYIMADDTTFDHSASDHKYAGLWLKLSCSTPSAGVGFSIVANSTERLQGTFKVRWVWG